MKPGFVKNETVKESKTRYKIAVALAQEAASIINRIAMHAYWKHNDDKAWAEWEKVMKALNDFIKFLEKHGKKAGT